MAVRAVSRILAGQVADRQTAQDPDRSQNLLLCSPSPFSVGLRHLMPKAALSQGPYSELAYNQKAPLVFGVPK